MSAYGATQLPGAVAGVMNRIDVFVLGTKSQLLHKFLGNDNIWKPFDDFQPVDSSQRFLYGPVVVTNEQGNSLDVFAIGINSRLYRISFDLGTKRPKGSWEDLGGEITGPPAVVARGRRLDVFVVGAGSALHHKWFDGDKWHPKESYFPIGGIWVGPPLWATPA
ncbi:hypothetical protein DL98DRAFT_522838 [Cadophora sp. DSE1049]|nr:hypothetical protein DL98DRAFT_522838 [Cadophora sp. DSE1049]